METAHGGEADKAGCHINLGLLALTKVCAALADMAKGGKTTHIPYRDATLTKILRVRYQCAISLPVSPW